MTWVAELFLWQVSLARLIAPACPWVALAMAWLWTAPLRGAWPLELLRSSLAALPLAWLGFWLALVALSGWSHEGVRALVEAHAPSTHLSLDAQLLLGAIVAAVAGVHVARAHRPPTRPRPSRATWIGLSAFAAVCSALLMTAR